LPFPIKQSFLMHVWASRPYAQIKTNNIEKSGPRPQA